MGTYQRNVAGGAYVLQLRVGIVAMSIPWMSKPVASIGHLLPTMRCPHEKGDTSNKLSGGSKVLASLPFLRPLISSWPLYTAYHGSRPLSHWTNQQLALIPTRQGSFLPGQTQKDVQFFPAWRGVNAHPGKRLTLGRGSTVNAS